MKDLAFAAFHFGNRQESAAGIFDVCEISRCRQVAQGNSGLSFSDLHDNAGDHGSRRLPGTIRVKRARDNYGNAKRVMKAESYTIGGDFRCAVRGLRLQGMLLIDWNILCRAVDFARRSLNESLD